MVRSYISTFAPQITHLTLCSMSSIKVPPLGESIVEATVSRWLKKEGDAVAVGDALVELETDKITVEVPALEAGVLSARAKGEGDVVAVGDVLGEIAAGVAAAAPANSAPTGAGSAGAGAAGAGTTGTAAEAKVSPAAARLATETGINPATVQGTGRGGVVSKADVMGAAQSPAAPAPAVQAPAVSAPAAQSSPAAGTQRETREKMTTRRKRIAENLLQSQHATAHLTTFNEIDMTAITALRERLKDRVEKEQGVKLSFMPFFAKAAALALKAYPVVNAQIDGDTIVYKHYVNMGIAVASDAGLVVPNVKDCDQKSVVQIGKDIGAVAKRARDGKLSMDDLTGGTFTITNGGVFGSLISTPIINYPQVGILGLHKTQDRPVAIDGKVEVRPMMYLSPSFDHRVIDGAVAARFVSALKRLLERPEALLLDLR